MQEEFQYALSIKNKDIVVSFRALVERVDMEYRMGNTLSITALISQIDELAAEIMQSKQHYNLGKIKTQFKIDPLPKISISAEKDFMLKPFNSWSLSFLKQLLLSDLAA
ncbi:MAG: hypothetical protein FWB96_06710 [Defluviitaleaceae bacterium]|nr:hypothetical protein [Defluviitaleaceae bacterium]MCL2262615.1 hypothetical protein [Defluviitaleaceae bacterium]